MDFTQSMDNGYMIPTSVAVGSGEATDIRCICDTVEDFKTFLSSTGMDLRYDGLVTYEKVNKLLKVYKGDDTWQTVGEGGGNVDTSSFITLTQLSQQLSNYYTKSQTDNKIVEEIAKAQIGGSGEEYVSISDLSLDGNELKLIDKNGNRIGNGVILPTGDSAEIPIGNTFDSTEFAYEVMKAINGGTGESVKNANTADYLKIPVYNNSNDHQATHPSVLYFKDAWNGYKFWMGMTPYENENESVENPSIVASNDGINWVVPEGLVNPLMGTNKVSDYHNSDTHLVFVEGKMECWYRKRTRGALGDSEVILRCVSTDGIKWSLGEELIKFDGVFDKHLSPVVLYEDGKYKVWFVNFSDAKIEYYEGKEATNLVKIRDIAMPNCDNLKVWHMDIKHTCNGYEMYFCAGSNYLCYSMYYANSLDNITYSTAIKVMNASESGFDRLIYRPCFIDIGFDRYIYYGGVNKSNTNKWYIGLTKSKIYSPTILDGNAVSNADVTGVTLDKRNVDLYEGDTLKLIATVEPRNARDKTVVWETDNTNVLAVDQYGNILAKSVGTASVTVTTVDGAYTDTCKVTVSENLNSTIKAGENLFDRSAIIEGGFYDPVNGAWKTDASYNSSGYIEVLPGMELIRDEASAGLCYWDENRNFISGLSYTIKVGIVPPNAKYVTFAYLKSKVNGVYLMLTDVIDNKLPIEVELFDKESIVEGKYIDPAGITKEGALYGMSDYIEVGTGITLTHSNALRVSLFDSKKQFIGTLSGSISDSTQRHSKYAVVSFELSKLNNVSLKRTV